MGVMTVLVPVNWHLHVWQQAIVYNVLSLAKIQTKSGCIGTIMCSRLVYKCETATGIWVLCHLTASKDYLGANK